jgi:hypothetical protein
MQGAIRTLPPYFEVLLNAAAAHISFRGPLAPRSILPILRLTLR